MDHTLCRLHVYPGDKQRNGERYRRVSQAAFYPENDSRVPCEAESLLGPDHTFALGVARSNAGVQPEPSSQEQTDAPGSPSIHGGAVAGLPWNDP